MILMDKMKGETDRQTVSDRYEERGIQSEREREREREKENMGCWARKGCSSKNH